MNDATAQEQASVIEERPIPGVSDQAGGKRKIILAAGFIGAAVIFGVGLIFAGLSTPNSEASASVIPASGEEPRFSTGVRRTLAPQIPDYHETPRSGAQEPKAAEQSSPGPSRAEQKLDQARLRQELELERRRVEAELEHEKALTAAKLALTEAEIKEAQRIHRELERRREAKAVIFDETAKE